MKKLTKIIKSLFPLKFSIVPHVVAQFQSGLQPYKYFRLNMPNAYGGATQDAIYEFQLRENVTDANSFLTGGTASASSSSSPYLPANAFDGNTVTAWRNVASAFPATLTYQLAAGNTKIPRVLTIYGAPGPDGFTFEASNDGVNWSVIRTVNSGEVIITSSDSACPFIWVSSGIEVWRLLITATQGNTTNTLISEVQIKSSIDGTNLLTGGLATAKGKYVSFPSQAFDGNLTTYWQNNYPVDPANSLPGTWLAYILPNGSFITHIAEIFIRGANTNTNPTNIKLQKSTDGMITWEDIKVITEAYYSGSLECRILYDYITVDTTKTRFLCHAEGNNGETFITDQKGHPFTRTGTATISNTQAAAGLTSLNIGGGTNSGWRSTNYETDFAISPYYQEIFTIRFRMFPTSIEVYQYLFGLMGDTSQYIYGYLTVTGAVGVSITGHNVTFYNPQPSVNLNQWNEIVLCCDGPSYYIGINGKVSKVVGITPNSTAVMNSAKLFIGRYISDGYQTFSGYIDEFEFIKGQCLFPGNYTVPQIPFEDPTPITIPVGWEEGGIKASVSFDRKTASSLTSLSTFTSIRAIKLAKTSGDRYFEITTTPGTNVVCIGLSNINFPLDSVRLGDDANSWDYQNNGNKGHSGVSAYGATWNTADVTYVIGVRLNHDTGVLTFYKDGVSQGTAFTGVPTELYPTVTFRQDSTSVVANFGDTTFQYQPSGTIAWNT
jgi:hypothetical protein